MMRFLGAILLVAGTAIGAGMLALPAVTAHAGFMPSLLMFAVCWGFMTLAALLLASVTLAHPDKPNLVSLARATLGTWGAWGVSATYLLLLYALMTAYLTGGGPLVASALKIGPQAGILLFAALFGTAVWVGTRCVDLVNRALMVALVVTYGLLVGLLSPHVRLEGMASHWTGTSGAFAVIFTSFGFSIIVPSLAKYLNYQARQLRLAIVVGSALPLMVYAIWEWAVLGAMPPEKLMTMLQPARDLPVALAQRLDNGAVPWICTLFGFAALVTSFLGVGLSLSHFLEDGLRRPRLASLLALLPPLVIALIKPGIFIGALEYAGILVALLLGVFPCLMAWKISGRKTVCATGLFFLLALGGEMVRLWIS
jgi:tyrosine-specific transport protein